MCSGTVNSCYKVAVKVNFTCQSGEAMLSFHLIKSEVSRRRGSSASRWQHRNPVWVSHLLPCRIWAQNRNINSRLNLKTAGLLCQSSTSQSHNCLILCLTFWGTIKMFTQQLHHFRVPITMYKEFDFPICLPILLFSLFLNCNNPSSGEVVESYFYTKPTYFLISF